MRIKAVLLGALAATALATGCVTPTPMDLQAADEGRVQAEQILGSFAQALQQRDPQALEPLVAPYLRPLDVRLLKMKLVAGSSLGFYEGYAPDLARPLADVSWREWRDGMVVLQVPYADHYGVESEDTFRLHNREGRWYLVGFELKDVQPGDLLNPPDEVRELLGDKAAELMEKLKKGNFMEVFYEVPKDAVYRRVERTWWEKATSDKPEAVSLMEDLEKLQMFTVLDWPEPEEASFVYAPGGVGVSYEIPYVWPAVGINQPDVLSLEFVFLRLGEGWLFYQPRMSALGIPWSQ